MLVGKLNVTVCGISLGHSAMSLSPFFNLNGSLGGWALIVSLLRAPMVPNSRINALDSEVHKFELLDVDTDFRSLLEGQFKPILDFLLWHDFYIRHLDVCRLEG